MCTPKCSPLSQAYKRSKRVRKDVKLQIVNALCLAGFQVPVVNLPNCYMKGTEFTTLTLPKIVSESGVFDMMISQKHWQVFY